MTDTSKRTEELDIPGLLNQCVSVQQYAGFQACLCDIGRPSERQLILSCYPYQSKKNTPWTEISSGYKVVCRGQQRSQFPLKKGEKVFFSLSNALVPSGESCEEPSFLRWVIHGLRSEILVFYFYRYRQFPYKNAHNYLLSNKSLY